ncbi:hypothetical protein HYT84_03280 [Candidatus Micrarchaeota archaeon]|nr:hypothetical protein [Candidatus Micrarchaeota archaeon]
MKTILFYWGKGSDTRVKIIHLIADSERLSEPCYINIIAEKFKVSHVAIKKHIDLLIDEGYLSIINPDGKPHYLILTEKGIEILKEFSKN